MNNNIKGENMCQTESRTYNKYLYVHIMSYIYIYICIQYYVIAVRMQLVLTVMEIATSPVL